MEISGKVFNFLGDSITQCIGASSYEKCFVALFAAAHPDAIVNNYGLGGTRIAPQIVPSSIPQHDRDFASRVKDMDERADPSDPEKFPNAIIGEGQCNTERAFAAAYKLGIDTYILEVEYFPSDYAEYIKKSIENINAYYEKETKK